MAGKKASGSAVVRHELKENLQAGDTILEMKNIVKKFDGVTAVDGVSFSMKKGEIVAIIGPSGSGKSTLLRSINGLENITDGEIDLYGTTGMVFQHFNLFPHMTCLGNITYAPIKVNGVKKADIEKRAEELLELVGLVDKRDVYPGQISGGQKQRIAIARALAMDPDLMLFDEPTSALDPEITGTVLSVMQKLSEQDMSMIIVTHEMQFARNVADRVLFMNKGKIVEEGPPEEIFGNPKSERLRDFLKAVTSR